MKQHAFLASLVACALLPATALALGKDDIVKIGVGAQFQGGINAFNKPSDQTVNGGLLFPEYPGFFGSSIGGGGFIDVRFINYVGLEFDVNYTTDKGSATLTINEGQPSETKFDITIQHNAIHLPLLLKGVTPGTIARAFFMIGPEFVVPVTSCPKVADSGESPGAYAADHPNCVVSPALTEGLGALGYPIFENNASYVMVTGGFGVEFSLPIPKVDVRIPFSLRVSGTPSVSSARTDREFETFAANAVTSVQYATNWWIQAVANLGVGVYF